MKFYEEQALAGALELTDSDLETAFGGWGHRGGEHDDDWGHHGWGHHDWNDGGYPFFGYPAPSYYPIPMPSYYGGPSYHGTSECGC